MAVSFVIGATVGSTFDSVVIVTCKRRILIVKHSLNHTRAGSPFPLLAILSLVFAMGTGAARVFVDGVKAQTTSPRARSESLVRVSKNGANAEARLNFLSSGTADSRAPQKDSATTDVAVTRVVRDSDNWSVNRIATTLTSGVAATITLPRGPLGIDTGGTMRGGGPWGQYQIRITDGSKSESVYVLGGSCKAGVPNCTVTFVPYFNHAANVYTLGSNTSGIQEAINDACGLYSAGDWYKNGKCSVTVPPLGSEVDLEKYDIYGPIFFHAYESRLSGYGAVLNNRGRGPAIINGYLTPVIADGSSIAGFPIGAVSNYAVSNTIEGFGFRSPASVSSDPAFAGSRIKSVQYDAASHLNTITTESPHNLRTGDFVSILFTDHPSFWGDVPSIKVTGATTFTYYRDSRGGDISRISTPGLVALQYCALLDNGTGGHFVDLHIAPTDERGHFNNGIDFWDDENATVVNWTNNGIGLSAGANWVGNMFYSGGARNLPNHKQQLAPVITIRSASLTNVNGAFVSNSNGLYIYDSVIQAQPLWQVWAGNLTGNYQGAYVSNIYSEVSLAMNGVGSSPWPNGGIAGLISARSSGSFLVHGTGTMGGELPNVGNGSMIFGYYVVARDVTDGTATAPLPVAIGKSSGSDHLKITWPRVSSGAHTIVYDLLRKALPAGSMSAAAGSYVAPYDGGCDGGTKAACGAVAVNLPQGTDFQMSHDDNTTLSTSPYHPHAIGNLAANIEFWPGQIVTFGTPIQTDTEHLVTAFTSTGVTQFSLSCGQYGVSTAGGFTSCLNASIVPNNAVPNLPALMLVDGNNSGGAAAGNQYTKGRINLWRKSILWPQHFITLVDSTPQLTQSTTGYRPIASAKDTWIGTDVSTRNVNLTQAQLAFGSPVAISSYIGNVGDDKSWKERLTETKKSFAVPVLIEAGSTLTVGSGTALSQMKMFKTSGVSASGVPGQSCVDIKAVATGLTEADQVTGVKPPKPLGNLSVNAYAGGSDTLILHFCNTSTTPATVPAGTYSFLGVH